ncbi:TPA: MARTX multifunctional-autoprocessing repeats-in-toxin holotoxin RtxA [Vibrio cholerae]|uniref:MARTX multifunctional-autoprocessing repeats-in-toxin holotoxin RtxA n=1 Tax=Vibrio TaxID=662 RepID=UPI000A111753|nr:MULTISPECIES: MARTX multifunctional-autoprocessing repeats-in-toxin holotoxin RtxA [Vibrio]MEB5597215.1 MARTX multifunctional-autoprocessing repeats-in-toxin holotoxin RtxA [Vibrio cholerae]ORP19368.1 RTX toxin [Vibrio paracholerae]RBM91003.1 MARTX multifunctional-autoprocessing repeats-in-toxin holotoxin RtxA [Vibrio paracholerae]GHX39299.1 RTX cytotoxin [Vibrio cholerae]GHZ38519.1 RTX cytotoxin [Vibrio cholerae]
MGKPFWRSVEYFFTGNYSADDGNNNIVAIGFGGQIHAYGGDDHVTVGSIGATVYTGSGNDTVVGGSAYLKVNDTTGHLTVKGAAGYADIHKNGNGNVSFAGAAGGVSIDHLGNHGDVSYGGAAAYNGISRKGVSGNVTFKGAGGYNSLWHETNQGNLSFIGAGAGNKLDRTAFNRYQGSRGDVTFDGAGAANSISSRVETGNITFRGAGADNHLVRKGKVGDITLQGAGASNRIERTHQAGDVYTQTRGNIRFEGVGGYNSLYSDVAHGDIHFSGGGAYNTIIRKGSGSDFDAQGMEYAKADEIVLTTAQMHGFSIANGNKLHTVSAIKSQREPNTYLFAIADDTYTKINKIRLYNDAKTGKLNYYSEAWFKSGNHLENLANADVSSSDGFEPNPLKGGYTLSNIGIEHQQSVTVHAVEKSLTEYEWVTYANGAVIDAKEVSLSDAKMGGHAIYADGTKVDVKAVKSNRQPNTYIYAKVLGPYTKIVVVELANDPKTGALKYQARSWYKEGDHSANIANQDISSATGYNPMGKGGYSLSDLHYSVNAVRSTSETVADIEEYTDQTLFKPANDSGESSGDVRFNGAGGGNVIKSNVTRGNVHFNGGGIANVILHSSQFGNTEFNGGGAANVIVKSGEEGDLTFRGAGLANVLVHQSQQGKMDVYAGGAVNVLVRLGDGQYLAHLLAYGNISVQKGSGDSRVVMLGGYNTHTQIGSGNGLWLAAGGFNVMTQVGKGDVAAVLAGGANVLTKMGEGELTSGMLGGANVITHISNDDQLSNTTAVALGGANILTKKGKGNTLAVMGGGANVLTHVGDGTTTGVMVGGANILTKIGNGDTTGIMLGVGNVLTHVGDGQTLGVMGAAGNIFTKVGDGTSIAVMIGAGNIFTHVGEGNAWALMGGLGNVFTKVGNGDALALMVAEANVFTHIGDGMSVALMLAKGNVATKVGNGTTLAAMVGNANIFTHIGHGSTFAAMIGQANIMTKVGNDLTAALMVGKANIMTHVGDGTSLGLFAGEVNVMTKVGNGTTLAAMFGKANIMTHVGDGLTGVLALGEANIVTKVGDDFMGVVAAAKANVVTHVGDATTAAVLAGKGNILTKVGEGTTVGLLISDVGNVMTHVGDGTTIGIAKGKANLITKVGDGLGVNVAWGQANVFTQVGDGDRYNFAKGEANLITKVGDGQEVSVVQGEANIITHVGNGDDYTGAWGKANVITKVGNGRNVVLAKGEANIVTQVGNGDSFNALWSKGNIVTKVGDGMQVTAAKGQANITTTVGNGLSVTAAYGDANINTKVGDGVSVNVAWGKYNINTKVGDGLNVAVMKGKANANIHVGDGLNINASYAQNNVAIKVGNGDFYSLAVASSNTSSNKLSALFDNIKQTVLGVGGSQAINYLVQGDEASSSGTHKGRGAIATPEITKLDGFHMDAIKEVGSDLGDSLTGSVTKVDTPDLNKMQHALNVDDSSVQAPNLIVNGDFELGEHGWQSTHGVEASYAGSVYGVEGEGHGARVIELDTYTNTSLYQDLANLAQGEVIAVSFDFAKRAGLSNNEGIEVLWNGEVVFSSSGDESAWQQKTLKLTAQAGSNRIEFKGTGHNDGLGYILDNVVATSESSQQANAIREHASQPQAAQNALSDKERAEADRQRLEQEKQKQLDAVAGSQNQLEATDQQALENNGQAQRDAVQEESETVTAELTKLAQGLDVLDGQATHTGESGDQWRNEFASGLLAGVQTQLDDAKQLANDKIAEAKQTHADNQNKVKDAVAKSEAGVAKGEQNRAGAEQDIADAQADAEKRKADALAKGNEAKQAEFDAHNAVNNAQSRGDRDVQMAENKANQAQADAQGAKQNEGDRPDRQGVTGSGLSGNAHSVEGAGETDRHVNTDSQTNADGRFSEGLTEQEQEALEGATNAVNRLQINAGIRGKNSVSTITSMFTEANTDSIVVPTTTSQDVVRKEVRISGVNLEGLGEASHDSAVSLVAARAEKVANLYRWLDSDYPRATEQYIPVPGFERVDVNVSDETKQRLTQFVSGYIEHTDNQVPKDQAQALATLFVEATLNYDWDKRVEFLTKLESYGYSFEAPHGENSLVSFWSGRNFKEYRNVLDNAQPDGKKVVYDIDVQGNAFALKLNKQLMRWGDMFLDLDNADQNHLQSSIEAAAYSNTGFWSSVYATGAKDDVYVIAEGGMRLGNYFWNVELPLLRQLQREGLVGEIRLLDKPVSEYKDVPVNEIGHKLTDAGVGVKVRFDALSAEQQAELLAINPKGYKADSLVELDVKLSAIDSMLRDALPFYSLRTERNLLVQEGDEGFKVRAWPGNDDKSKTIVLDNPEDATQQKTIERFILANFQNFEQMPDELFLVDNKVISHDKGITHVLAQKVDGAWLYNAKVDLMSVTELLDAANVTGKIRGESYQQVIDALADYHASITEHADYAPESVEKLLNLRKNIEGYVLGHPDSGRIAAMNSLLNQVNTRLEEVSVLAVSEPNIKAQDSFSRLYDQLETANLKGTKHLYLDQNGEFVTKGKGHLVNIDLLGNSEAVIEKVKLAVSNEYGQTIADTIFAGLTAHDLAKDGKGIDIAGLKKVHLAIEQHLSPVSATLFLWKPSDHSALGHAALQIGQGRNQINTDQALAYNQSNYVSWWPMGSKSSSLNHLFDVSSEAMPDLKLRWKDFSQPAAQGESLAFDMQSEENDDFGLKSAEDKLKDFIKQVASASGVDEKFKDISEAFTMMALMNPDILESANIPEHISKPFVDQWNDTSYDMQDVAQRFAKELQEQAKVAVNSEQMEQQISEVVRRFAKDELDKIQTFKEMQADQGRVFRINLEGLDVAAMQAEWHRLSNDSDARYQLLNKNCSSIVAKVLKAGGADKLIGHTWRPKFGVWTPTELFNFAQDLQEAQLVSHTKKDKQHIDTDSLQSTDRVLESLGESKQTTLDLSSVLTKDELKNEAKVFAKPIGESYQKILDQLDLLHATQGDKQLEAGLRLNNLVDDYVSSHEKSGRNTALLSLKNRVTESLYSNVAQESRVEIAKLSADRIDLAVDLLHRLRSSTNEVSSVVDIKSLADGTKYNSQESLAVLSKQEVPFNKDLQDQQLVQGRVAGEAVLNKVQLSDDEIKGIKWYTSEGFQYVNEALRKEEKLAYFVKDNAVNAVKGLSKLETFEGTVYRAFMPGVSLNDLASHVTPGQLFSDQGFTSTSTSTELAKSFRGGKGTVILTILDAKGTNVAGLAQLNQAEVLLNPGAHLRIEAVKETDQNLHIVAKYTEEFRAGEIVRNLFDGKTIGIAINQNTSTINESVVTSFDHDDITAILKPKPLLEENKLGVGQQVQNRNVQNWYTADVTVIDGGDTRFDGQVIVQMENDPVVAKAAASLAGKHAENSVIVQLDADGNYRVVYGEPSKLDGKLRWQLVGHGRDHSEHNNTYLSGHSADELAVKLAKFQQTFNQAENISSKPDHISIVGCSLVSNDKQKGFGHQFINAMDANGLRVDVSVRSTDIAVDAEGRKYTKDANGDWVQKAESNKVSLSWDAQGEVVAKDERIRNGIAEGDIDLSRIGVSDVDEPARGAIGDNSDVFDAPEKRKPETEVIANSSNSNQLSYSGNIQVNVGEGEFTAVNWGTSNVGIKVGTGGFKSLAFGDNNVMVHLGNGDSRHSANIAGYQAFEGAQMFVGNRNVSFNMGRSNDLLVMMEKSIPTPPLVNPFDGAARISGVLQNIATSGQGEGWLAAQEQQWTLSGAKKFVKDMSGLDQSSSVDYTTLVELDSQNERDSRGLKHDAEATLNKQYNQWLSGNGNSGTSQLSRADKLRQANEKLAFNFAVGGQGADIQVTTGNWNFMFGDNIQSILDTNLGSLFGLMTQQFTATGQAKTTFTYTPQDLPRQLKNKLLGKLAGVGADTTLADIFGVDYTASGQIVSRNGQAVDGVAILKEMLEVIGEFSGDQLQAFIDPAKLLDSLKAGIDMGADGIKSFAETHGLKEKAPEEEKDNSSVSVNGASANSTQGAADGNIETTETQERAFGFNSLNLPNLFATIFSQDKQQEMTSLVENLKQNLTADLLNMKEKTFDFLRNSGHLQGDGDINISLGNYNFNWGGDGKDLGAYLGDNNNFWGGRGDDVFYATGTSNIFTGGEGNDMGVLMGRENMMFGGEGNDTAVVAGRINHVFLGAGDDQSFVFGEGSEIDTGTGRDYVVTSGNFNRVDTGDDQDYSVTIGNNNQVELGAGDDFANVFGNYNRINAGTGNDVVKLMGYHAVLNGGDGDDHLIAAAISKFSHFDGGDGRDLMVLGGYQNTFKGGTDVDSFVVSGDVIDNLVEDIRSEDNIVFNGIDWQKLWFERSGYDLKLSILRDPSNDSDQAKFEHIGSVTFSDYFNGNRAQVVIAMSEKDLSGEREYTMLSDSAIDALVQAMSGFEPQAGDNGFIDSLESKSQAAIGMAWSDVVHKKGLMV